MLVAHLGQLDFNKALYNSEFTGGDAAKCLKKVLTDNWPEASNFQHLESWLSTTCWPSKAANKFWNSSNSSFKKSSKIN